MKIGKYRSFQTYDFSGFYPPVFISFSDCPAAGRCRRHFDNIFPENGKHVIIGITTSLTASPIR